MTTNSCSPSVSQHRTRHSRPYSPRLVVVGFVLFLTIALAPAKSYCATASSSESAQSQYESVRALDQYGNAVQLQNARAAADQQGRLVIGIRRQHSSKKCSFWILSTSTTLSSSPSPHLRTITSTRQRSVVPDNDSDSRDSDSSDSASTNSANSAGIVHWLWTPPPPYDSSTTAATTTTAAMVCTGVQADALWLVRQMQSYQKNRWERYNSDSGSLQTAVADCMRLFWGHDMRNQWHGTAWNVGNGNGDNGNGNDNSNQWARPLGVRALVLQGSDWYLVEPSGVVQQQPCHSNGNTNVNVCCMGPSSQEIQTKLQKELELLQLQLDDGEEVDVDDDMLQDILRKVLTSALGNTPEHVLLEVLSARGVERRSIAL
jgi:hypothetical protein